MTHAIDAVLRPLIRWYFQRWFWKYLPWKEKMLWFFCKHYFVVGETKLTQTLKTLTDKRYHVLVNVCGDDAGTVLEAEKTWKTYQHLIDIILEMRLRRFVKLSVKASRFGCFEKEIKYHARKLVGQLVARARHGDIKIVFDGERLKHCRWVLAFARSLNQRYNNVGVRLQAYGKQFLSRCKRSVETLDLSICKGAYDEPPWRAVSSLKEIRRNMTDAAAYALSKKCRIEVDTHDERIISECQDLDERGFISYGHLFNMKAHQAHDLRRRDKEEMHIYIVYLESAEDNSWIGFSIRRLIEKPTYLFLPLKMAWNKFIQKEEY